MILTSVDLVYNLLNEWLLSKPNRFNKLNIIKIRNQKEVGPVIGIFITHQTFNPLA
jgi:hypothetical protein